MGIIYTVSEMKRFINEYGITYGEIAKKSGVPISTIQKIFGGLVKKPRSKTLESLSEVFIYYDWKNIGSLATEDGLYTRDQLDTIGMVAEEHQYDVLKKNRGISDESYSTTYSKGSSAINLDENSTSDIFTQTGYTYNDYTKLELPKGIRVEVLDGKLIKMEAPTTRHQIIAGELFVICRDYVRKNKGKCVPFISPVAVRLGYKEDGSDKTVLEPDFLIVCDKNKILGAKTVNGAPDFVVEVISPSNRKYKMYEKMNKYRECGVREYWVIDYDKDKIIKYNFVKDGEIFMYSFADKVPVDIYAANDDPLVIDFAEIKEYIESIF